MNLAEYLAVERGRQALLCRLIKCHAPDLSRWASGERPCPPAWCVAIELATEGAVTRRELRPNDWQQIWPELVALNPQKLAGMAVTHAG